MTANAPVARGEHGRSSLAPGLDDAIDRGRIEVGAVGEEDDRGVGSRVECRQPAAQRCTRTVRPFRTADEPRIGVDVVGAEHDDQVAELARPAGTLDDLAEEELLLGGAEAAGRPGRENDGCDHGSILLRVDSPIRYARSGDVNIAYQVTGDGPFDLVLVHGVLFAATYPERTRALVLYGTYARRLRSDDYPWASTWENRLEAAAELERTWGEAPTCRRWHRMLTMRYGAGSSPAAARR